MTQVRRMTALAAAAVFALGVVACASQKEPATQAVANIEKSLEGAGEMAHKYLPERHAEATAKLAGLKDSIAAEDYKAVVVAAPALADEVRKLVADGAIRKAQVKMEMEAEWVELVKTMPAIITAVDNRIARLSNSQLPKGMSRNDFKALVAEYDGARDGWAKAAEAGNAGDSETAVTTARESKARIGAVMETLGIKAS